MRVERVRVGTGADLLTVFRNDIPLLSVLRDDLGAPDLEAARLRYVWVLNSARPSFLQRATSALPFFYWRTPTWKRTKAVPSPIFDLTNPRRSVYVDTGALLMQFSALDPSGWMVRATSRSYRGNSLDYRRSQILESLAALTDLELRPESARPINNPDLRVVEARLKLATQTLGGLASDRSLPEAYFKQREREQEARGHNWELLRQEAEANGLYFQSLGVPGQATHAILWVAREDLTGNGGTAHRFDARFLRIADPFPDPRLKNWKGYVEQRNAENGMTEMIPLAVYSLDHPSVPMLMVDFRAGQKNRRNEMTRRVINDAVFSVAGVSRFGNWPLMAGGMGYNFVRSRHGATIDRAARLRSYAQMRYRLAFDTELAPEFRQDLQRRLERMGLNPLEDNVFKQRKFAEGQYSALLNYARDERGLAHKLDKDRRAELGAASHGGFSARALRVLSGLTLGLYTHREKAAPNIETRLAAERRIARHAEFLNTVAASRSISEVSWNVADIRRALDVLTEADYPGRAAHAVAQVFLESHDDQLRLSCLRALHRIGADESRLELQKLAANQKLDEQWRLLARGYAETPSSVALDPIGPQDQIH